MFWKRKARLLLREAVEGVLQEAESADFDWACVRVEKEFTSSPAIKEPKLWQTAGATMAIARLAEIYRDDGYAAGFDEQRLHDALQIPTRKGVEAVLKGSDIEEVTNQALSELMSVCNVERFANHTPWDNANGFAYTVGYRRGIDQIGGNFPGKFVFGDILDLERFGNRLRAPERSDPISLDMLIDARPVLAIYNGGENSLLQAALVDDLNKIIRFESLMEVLHGKGLQTPAKAIRLLQSQEQSPEALINRAVVDEIYSGLIKPWPEHEKPSLEVDGPDVDTIQREETTIVNACIEELSPEESAAMRLYYVYGFTHAEVAIELNKRFLEKDEELFNKNSVKTMIFRAKQSVRSCVEKKLGEKGRV